MAKSLLIVESPAKTKTISKFLGKDYIIKSSIGHIRDLPKSASKTTKKAPRATSAEERNLRAKERFISRLGINPEKHWEANYEIIPGKEKVVADLKACAKKCDRIILATDLDREGEAIAWHLRQVIGGDDDKYQRIIFNEITASAVNKALENPRGLNDNQINAQQTRRFLDRVVGFMVSPLLWPRIARGLSAGRVQSVALRILCEREQEIRRFIPEEYWTIDAKLVKTKDAVLFAVTQFKAKKFLPNNATATKEHLETLKKDVFKVSNVIEKQTQQRPNAPFITSTLQQTASTRLHFGIKKTMMLAQQLYEAGAITYMRTDSTNISKEAIAAVRGYIDSEYGEAYLPKSPNLFARKNTAQEAHEAIRPTTVARKNIDIGKGKDAQALYSLIRNQFIACQMMPAQYFSTQIVINSEQGYQLRAKGRKCIFDGFTRILPIKDDEQALPDIKINDTLSLNKLIDKQHHTKPSPRFTEASLVKELEKKSIGRPSTYVPIITTLQQREYAVLENKKFYVRRVGELVDNWLQRFFADLVRLDFSVEMEQNLDKISKGELIWRDLLDEFYQQLKTTIENVEQDENTTITTPTTDVNCPECQAKMMLRYRGNDLFLGCSNYGNKENPCKKTLSLEPDQNNVATEENPDAERCPSCQSVMQILTAADGKHQLHVCANYPACVYMQTVKGDFAINTQHIPCHKCTGSMQLKSGRFGKYYSCDQCATTRKALADGAPAPIRMDPIDIPELLCQKVKDHYVLREGAAGLFLAASQYPKHRDARSPLIKEIASYKNQLEPRLQYICDAPLKDPEENDTILCFSKKNLSYYISSVKKDKRTKFRITYDPVAKAWRA